MTQLLLNFATATVGWKVLAVSLNANNFGLKQVVFISDRGECAEALANHIHVLAYKQGAKFDILPGKFEDWATSRGLECPEMKQFPGGKFAKKIMAQYDKI
jgi:hypothetical protein